MFMAIGNAQEIFAKGRSELVTDKNLSLPARHPFHFTPATPRVWQPNTLSSTNKRMHCMSGLPTAPKAVQWPPGEASALELAGASTPPARVSHCPPASGGICKVWSGAMGAAIQVPVCTSGPQKPKSTSIDKYPQAGWSGVKQVQRREANVPWARQ